MKKLMLIMALGGISVISNAQYNSAMDNQVLLNDQGANAQQYGVIMLNTGSNNQENPDLTNESMLSVNSIDAFQGYRNLPDNTQVSMQPMPKENVQANIRENTVMHNLGPRKGAEMLFGSSMKLSAMDQHQGNRTTKTTRSKTKLSANKVKTTTSSSVKMNSQEQFQGNRSTSIQTVYPVGTPPAINSRVNVGYDTSKNNGHCLGCGSGSLTDKHMWMYE